MSVRPLARMRGLLAMVALIAVSLALEAGQRWNP
jgi:hypothetical protein